MPVYNCKVPNCKSDTRKEGKYEKYPWMRGVTFHPFPSARKEANKRNAWIKMVRKHDLNPGRFDRICSLHFVGGKGPSAEHPIPTLFPYNNWMSVESAEDINRLCGEKDSVIMGPHHSGLPRDCCASTQTDLTLGKFTYTSLKKQYRICCEQDDAMDLQCADDHTDGERNLTVSLENVDSKLMESLHDFWQRGILCDINIKTRDGNLEAHSIVLATFSEHLCAHLSGIPQTSIRTLHVATEIDSLRKVLSLLYGENLTLDQRSVYGVMKAARMIGVESVAQICEMYMRQRVTSVTWTDRKHFIVTANSSKNGTTDMVKEVEMVQHRDVPATLHGKTQDIKVELETFASNTSSVGTCMSIQQTPNAVTVEPSSVLDATPMLSPYSTLYVPPVPARIKTEPGEREMPNLSSSEEVPIQSLSKNSTLHNSDTVELVHTVNTKLLAEDDDDASIKRLVTSSGTSKMVIGQHMEKARNQNLMASTNVASTIGYVADQGCNHNKAGCNVHAANNDGSEHLDQVENGRGSMSQRMDTFHLVNGFKNKNGQLEIQKKDNLNENPADTACSLYSEHRDESICHERSNHKEKVVIPRAEVDDTCGSEHNTCAGENACNPESKGQEMSTELALWSKENCSEKASILSGKARSQNGELNGRSGESSNVDLVPRNAEVLSMHGLKRHRPSKLCVQAASLVTIKHPRLDLITESQVNMESNEPSTISTGDAMSDLAPFKVEQSKPAEWSTGKSDCHFALGTEHQGDTEQVPPTTLEISKEESGDKVTVCYSSKKVSINSNRGTHEEPETKLVEKVTKDAYSIRSMKEADLEGVPEDFFGKYCKVVHEVADEANGMNDNCNDIDTCSPPKHNEAVGVKNQQYLQCKFCNFKKKIVNGCFKPFLEHYVTVHKKRLNLQCKLCSTVAKLEAGFIRHTVQCHDFHNYLNTVTLAEHSKYVYCGYENCNYKIPSYSNNKDLCFHRFRKHGIPLPAYVAKKQKLCHHCTYVTLSNNQLEEHIKCHTGERPYMCEECGKAFPRITSLKNHQKHYHRRERKYKCTKCNHASATKAKLDIHNRKHTGFRPHKCTVCTYASSTRGNLRVHMKKHHDIQI